MEQNFSLTNFQISQGFTKNKFWLLPSDFTSAIAYWVAHQNPNRTFQIDEATKAFDKYISKHFKNIEIPQEFSYRKLEKLISEEVFIKIPEIYKLNKMKPDFIDLGALARNIFFYDLSRTNNTTYLIKL